MASLFLIRHAEPEVKGVLLGQMDPALSRRGRIQAAALGRIKVEIAWTSPLRRAMETAHFVCADRVREIPELREIDQCEWTGKTWVEVEAQWGHLALRKSSDWLGVTAPRGESWTHFLERVRKAWAIVCAESAPAAIIAHQGVNAALKFLIDGSDPLQFTQAYGEVIRLEYD
jgi:broad specificity phosphatase PhoE